MHLLILVLLGLSWVDFGSVQPNPSLCVTWVPQVEGNGILGAPTKEPEESHAASSVSKPTLQLCRAGTSQKYPCFLPLRTHPYMNSA